MMRHYGWKAAEKKLNFLASNIGEIDRYYFLNTIAPLRDRYYNGDRSIKLYNEIMDLFRQHKIIKE